MCEWIFYTKWAYTIPRIDAKSWWLFGFLAQEGAYTSRCQMPEMRFRLEKMIYSREGPCNGENTTLLGSNDWNHDEDIDSGRWGGEGG